MKNDSKIRNFLTTFFNFWLFFSFFFNGRQLLYLFITCPFFREHFIALFAQSKFIWFYILVKFKKHLTFSRFLFVHLVLNVVSILPQPLIVFGDFSSGSQFLEEALLDVSHFD